MSHWLGALGDISGPWAAAMFRASWQGGLALALAWALCRLFRSMPARLASWLWRLAYLKLLVALAWSVPIDLPVLRALPHGRPPLSLADEAATLPAGSTAAPFPSPPSAPPGGSGPGAGGILLALWLLGVGIHAAWGAREWRRAALLRRHSRDAAGDPALAAIGAELSRRFGLVEPPPLLSSDRISGPILVGIRHPVIILPAILCRGSTPAQLRLMLAHELSHLRRHDLLWNWLPAIAQSLFFFHPVLWLVRRPSRLAQEIACDQAAVSATGASVHDYGQMLLAVASHRSEDVPFFAALGVAESRISIERRLMAMKRFHLWSGRRSLVAAALLAAAGVLGIAPWRLVAHEPPSPPPFGASADPGEADPGEAAKHPAGGDDAVPPPAGSGRATTVDLVGNIATTTAEIRAPGDGLIQDVGFKEGDHVKKGDLLFRLDARKAEAALLEAEAQFKAAQADLERSQGLLKSRTVSEDEYRHATAAAEVAQAHLIARKRDLEDTRIVAPFSGVMGECDIRAGLFVTRGHILSTLVEVDELKAEFRAPESLLPRLKAGQKVELTVPAYPERRFTGTVSFIAPQVDPATATILVKARVANVENRLRPGMHASIKLELAP